jgi:hypothetical protein
VTFLPLSARASGFLDLNQPTAKNAVESPHDERARARRRTKSFWRKPMSIRLSCECGKTLNVKDELEGKRIKCPNCKASLLVASDEPGSGAKKKKQAKTKEEAKSGGGKTIFVVLGLGAVLVACCCTSGVGGGAGWYFLKGGGGAASGQDAKLVGKWIAEKEVSKKGPPRPEDMFKLAFGGDIEFKKDGTVIDNTPMTPITQGKWKTVSTAGEVVTVELTQGPLNKKLDVRLVSNDSIKITPADIKMEFAFKRAP